LEKTLSANGRSPAKKHRLLLWIGLPFLFVVVVLLIAAEILLHRIEPSLRARVVEALSARFNSRVELKSLHVSLVRGLEVAGTGLTLYPYNLDSSTPTFAIDSFSFRTEYGDLLQSPLEIGHVDVHGMRIHLPPKSQRKDLPKLTGAGGSSDSVKIFVDEIRATDTVLTLGTDKPGKVPLEFDIRQLLLKSVGAGKPLSFVATLTNPKPIGNIQSTGSFGPWNSDDPRQTPVNGTYSFSKANLGTLKGIAGILSSTGRYQGTLDNIAVDGSTDTPDFEVGISGHKVALHTDFHAIVDGTNGDTYLQPVIGRFLHSSLTAKGSVVRAAGVPGHQIDLDVVIDQAYIQDLLRLGVHTDPPFMTGHAKLRFKLDLPPGPQDVVDRLKLQGSFNITGAHFSNQKVQARVDELSLRSQGKPDLAKQAAKDPGTANTSSQMQGEFNLANGLLRVADLNYDVPGANVKLDGVYSLDGNRFDFFGIAALKASLSELVGGWKGFFLKPADRFFRKNGHGLEVPIKITGTKSDPHFGLDLHHDDEQEQKAQQQKKSDGLSQGK
jgi:AsmA-like C-terminal region